MIVLWCIRKVFANCPTKNIKFLRSLWFFWRNKTLTRMRGAQRFSGIELLKIFRDRQKLVAFRKSQKLLNHSTLLKMYIVYFSKPGNKNWKLNVVVCQRIAHSSLSYVMEQFWRISLYSMCDWWHWGRVPMEEDSRKFSHIKLSNSVICEIL